MQTKRLNSFHYQNTVCIPLGKAIYAIIDSNDFNEIAKYRWFLKPSKTTSYATRKFTINSKTFYVKMHRQITKCPDDKVVHHINHNPLDNRKSNLLVVTAKEHDQTQFKS